MLCKKYKEKIKNLGAMIEAYQKIERDLNNELVRRLNIVRRWAETIQGQYSEVSTIAILSGENIDPYYTLKCCLTVVSDVMTHLEQKIVKLEYEVSSQRKVYNRMIEEQGKCWMVLWVEQRENGKAETYRVDCNDNLEASGVAHTLDRLDDDITRVNIIVIEEKVIKCFVININKK